MNKVYPIIIGVLLLIILAGVYKFIIRGNVIESSDSRVVIVLKSGDRNFILGEMRGLLAKIQQLFNALSNDDMETFTKVAKTLKEDSNGDRQQSLIGKMPIAFKQLSYKIHSDFGRLYDDAKEKKDNRFLLKEVSALMVNCVGCHAAFRLQEAKKE